LIKRGTVTTAVNAWPDGFWLVTSEVSRIWMMVPAGMVTALAAAARTAMSAEHRRTRITIILFITTRNGGRTLDFSALQLMDG
jgi:hypothetical protein